MVKEFHNKELKRVIELLESLKVELIEDLEIRESRNLSDNELYSLDISLKFKDKED